MLSWVTDRGDRSHSAIHDRLERLDEAGEIGRGELGLDRESLLLDEIVQRLFEHVTGDVEDDLAEHLHEPAVRVVREALVVRLLGEALHGVVVEPEVEDGVHHPGHRERRAGTDRHEQRIDGVAEALVHFLFEHLAW